MKAKINVSYLPDDRIVAADVEGDSTIAVVHRAIFQMAETSATHRANRLLLDFRNATLEVSIIDIYDLPSHFPHLGLTRFHKKALIVAQGRQDYEFMETVSVNRGYRVRVVADEDEAISWLKNSDL